MTHYDPDNWYDPDEPWDDEEDPDYDPDAVDEFVYDPDKD